MINGFTGAKVNPSDKQPIGKPKGHHLEQNGSTILIVDDELLNLKLLKTNLSYNGFRILEAANGKQAIQEAEKQPDLILLDVMMPGMDGIETFRRLKAKAALRDIPVIFLSAHTDTQTKVKCIEMGGVDYVSKPFKVQEVLARVRTHITIRKQGQKLQQYARKLEQMVEEKTQQLIHADRLATLGTFSAGIAHEIRNPLTGINTYIYNLEALCDTEEGLNGEYLELIQQIARQLQIGSNRIEAVIKKVLDFSKPIAPKMVLTNINKSVEEAIELASATLRKSGVALEKSLGSDIPRCYADDILLEQVIVNLINNAANAMQGMDGLKKIEVASSTENGHILVSVSDTGPGVEPALRKWIFDPFFTTDVNGSGIGLNIAQRIIYSHGGSIKVYDSRLGGAEFCVKLPVEHRSNSQ